MEATLLFVSLGIVLVFVYLAHKAAGIITPATLLALCSVVVGIAAANHIFEDELAVPPRVMFAIAGGILWMFYSLRAFSVVDGNAGIRALLGISIARIPVEVMLHGLAAEGSIPLAMSWSGTNFDILSGIFALALWLVSFWQPIPTWLLRAFCVMGLLLLANVVVTALLSAPTPLQQLNFAQPNRAILRFPFALLPAAIVPAVLYSHIRLWLLAGKV